MSRQIAGVNISEEIAEAKKRIDAARILLVDALGHAHRLTVGEYDLQSGHIADPLVAMAEELRQLAYAIDNLDNAEQYTEQTAPRAPSWGAS
jgi:hypothetical protein